MMANTQSLAVFEDRQVRRVYDEASQTWFFSVVDVIAVLSESSVPKRYWSDLKRKLTLEGSQLYEKIVQLIFIIENRVSLFLGY